MSEDGRTYWLLVERLQNWKADQREAFKHFGVPNTKASLASQVKRGDLLIFYVSSGVSKFADVREAIADGLQKLVAPDNYDTVYPWKLNTRPYLTLPEASWVPIQELLEHLSLTRNRPHWSQTLRQSLLRLQQDDGALILHAMEAACRADGVN